MPSTGSMTQRMPLVPSELAPSSPRKPSSGRRSPRKPVISFSEAMSISVTTSMGLDLVAATPRSAGRPSRSSAPARRAASRASSRSSSYSASLCAGAVCGASGCSGSGTMLLARTSGGRGWGVTRGLGGRAPPVGAGGGRARCARGAAADRAQVVARGEGAQGAALRGAAPFGGRALQEEVADGRGEPGVGAHGGGPGDRQAQLGGLGGGLGVEVVLDLHVVGDEPDGGHHDGRDARGVPLLQVVADVRLQPGDVRGAAAGLVDEPPGVVHTGLRTDGVRDHPRHVQVLGDVGAALAAWVWSAGCRRCRRRRWGWSAW